MTGYFRLHDWAMLLLLLLLVWPGYRDIGPLEAPKKGYWTVGSIFWPVRRAYRSLWPVDPALVRPMQNALALALALAFLADLAARFWPAAAGAMSRGGSQFLLVAVALLVGRASGFWSADRRIAKLQSVKEVSEAGAPAQVADRA